VIALDLDHFAAAGGLALRRRRWSGPDARRALAIVHGFAEHSGRYDHVARWFAGRGWRVHAYDQRGHGESEGPRNHTPSFARLQDDLERFLSLVRREEDGRPLVLLGHSMGGLEVVCLLGERRPALSAAVAVGPALSVAASRGRTAAIGALSALVPTLRLPTGLDASGLSRDPAVVRAYESDPLISTRGSARLLAELLAAAERAIALAPRIEVPLLLLHGEADPICDVAGSRRFHAALAPGRGELCTYPGLRHEVLNEPEWPDVLADVEAWLARRALASVA
jgi:alpha-beta hydrolase superfamily lysophospholipase